MRAPSLRRFRFPRLGALVVPSIWAVAYLVISTLIFGMTFGVLFSIQGAEGTPLLATADGFWGMLTMAVAVYGYGVFVWNLMAIVTLPVTLAPIVVWVGVVNFWNGIETSRRSVIFATGILAVFAFLAREAYLDFPVFLHDPVNALQGRWVSTGYALSAITAVWGGLLLPRLCMPELAPGALLPAPHDRVLATTGATS